MFHPLGKKTAACLALPGSCPVDLEEEGDKINFGRISNSNGMIFKGSVSAERRERSDSTAELTAVGNE